MTSYCINCGILHNPLDGPCIGCNLITEIEALKLMNKRIVDAIPKSHKYLIEEFIHQEVQDE